MDGRNNSSFRMIDRSRAQSYLESDSGNINYVPTKLSFNPMSKNVDYILLIRILLSVLSILLTSGNIIKNSIDNF